MKFKLSRYIAIKFSAAGNNRRFLNFARLVAFISVMLGSMALIIAFSILDGFESALKENAVKFKSHITVRLFDNKTLDDYRTVINKIKPKFKEIADIAPVIEREALISSGGFVEGIILRGIMPEFDITNLKDNIIDGKFEFAANNANEIIIGNRLSKKLKSNIGSDLIIYIIKGESLNKFKMPDIEKLKLSGIYETGMAQYDDIYVYAPYKKAVNLFQMPLYSASSIDIILHDIDDVPRIADSINKTLAYPYYVYTVFDLHSAIFSWIELQKEPIPLVLGLISIVAIFNIITILLITVLEKTYSIGILRALGMSGKHIVRIFLIQGLNIGFWGTITGCLLGLGAGIIQQTYHIISLSGEIYFLDSLPVKFELWHFAVVISTAITLSFLATLIPAIIASKIQPVRALRFK